MYQVSNGKLRRVQFIALSSFLPYMYNKNNLSGNVSILGSSSVAEKDCFCTMALNLCHLYRKACQKINKILLRMLCVSNYACKTVSEVKWSLLEE